jgi:hypothetical protein
MARLVAVIAKSEGASSGAVGTDMIRLVAVLAKFGHVFPFSLKSIVQSSKRQNVSEWLEGNLGIFIGSFKDRITRPHKHPRERICVDTNVQNSPILTERFKESSFKILRGEEGEAE